MQNYIIAADSACDLPEDIIKKFDIKIIPYELTFDGENYINSLNLDLNYFYQEIRSGKLPKTTQINSTRFFEYFEQFLKKGLDVIFIGLSSALTGTYSPLNIAVKELKEVYKNNKVIVIDSLSASLGQGMLICEACEKRAQGYPIEKLEQWLNEKKYKIYHIFTVNDLFHLKRGGRISSSAAIIGSMLSIKPLLKINDEGALEVAGRGRGRRASMLALINNMKENISKENNDTIFIAHADCYEDAKLLASEIKIRLKINNIIIGEIGPIIGTHAGAETLAILYWAEKR